MGKTSGIYVIRKSGPELFGFIDIGLLYNISVQQESTGHLFLKRVLNSNTESVQCGTVSKAADHVHHWHWWRLAPTRGVNQRRRHLAASCCNVVASPTAKKYIAVLPMTQKPQETQSIKVKHDWLLVSPYLLCYRVIIKQLQ